MIQKNEDLIPLELDTPPTGLQDSPTKRTSMREKPWFVRGITLSIALSIWWAVTVLKLVRPLFLPSPGSVWNAFVKATTTHQIAPDIDRMMRGASISRLRRYQTLRFIMRFVKKSMRPFTKQMLMPINVHLAGRWGNLPSLESMTSQTYG